MISRRKNLIIISVSILALALTAPACGDSGGSGSGSGGNGGSGTGDGTGTGTGDGTGTGTGDGTGTGTGDTDTTTGSTDDMDAHGAMDDDSSMMDDDSSMMGDGGPAMGEGACTNEADLAIVTTVDVTAAATTAGTECLFAADPGACANEKVIDETGVSAGCSACYVEQILCAIDNCLAQCAPPNQASEDCGTCRAEFCTPLFEPCSGLAPSSDEE